MTGAGRGAAVLPKLKQVVLKRSGAALALWGEAGIGKSHAAQEVRRALACQSFGFPATAPLGGWVRGMPRPSGRQALPAWAEPLLDRLQNGEAVEARRAADALGALLAGLAPVLLLLEDIHEADPERLELIQALARTAGRSKGVGLLVTSRVEPPEGFEGHRLEPLTGPTFSALLEGEVRASLPGEALEWVYSRAAGNPLFSLEYLRYLARQGFLWNDGRLWRWREPSGDPMPLTVEALVEQQILQVSRDAAARQALEAKAVLPPGTTAPVWAAVAGLDEPELEAARATLQRQGVLREDEFAHPLFREVRLKTLRPQRRQALARRALEAVGETDLRAAVDFVKDAELDGQTSLDWFRRAAEAARASGNPVQAARLMGRAVAYTSGQERRSVAMEAAAVLEPHDLAEAERLAREALAVSPDDLEAVYLLAGILAGLRRGPEVEQLLRRLPAAELEGRRGLFQRVKVYSRLWDDAAVRDLWQAHAELRHTATPEIFRLVGVSMAQIGDTDAALSLIAEGLAHPSLVDEDRALLSETLGIIRFNQSDYAEAERLFTQTIGLFGAVGMGHRTSATHFNLALAMQKQGRFAQASRVVEQAAQLAAQSGDSSAYQMARSLLGEQLTELGQFERAEEVLQASLEAVERWPLSLNQVEMHGNLNDLYRCWDTGHSGVLALRHGRAALDCARRLDNPRFLCEGLFYAALGEALFGSARRALELALEQEALATRLTEPRQTYRAAWTKAAALAALGQPDEALAEYRRAYQTATEAGAMLHAHKLGLEVARLSTNLEQAQEHLSWFEERGLMNGAGLARRYFPELAEVVSPPKPQSLARLEVLGPMQWSAEGQLTAIRGQKRKELLAMLLEARIAGRGEVRRLDLLDALYPGDAEERAANALKVLVNALRADLGSAAIATTATGYALGAEVASDAETFLHGGEGGLWRGAYLEGLSPLDPNVWDSVHLALRSRVEALMEADPREAARLGRLLTESDPYDPAALRLALEALRRAQNHKALGRLYAEARARMAEVGEQLPPSWQEFLA